MRRNFFGFAAGQFFGGPSFWFCRFRCVRSDGWRAADRCSFCGKEIVVSGYQKIVEKVGVTDLKSLDFGVVEKSDVGDKPVVAFSFFVGKLLSDFNKEFSVEMPLRIAEQFGAALLSVSVHEESVSVPGFFEVSRTNKHVFSGDGELNRVSIVSLGEPDENGERFIFALTESRNFYYAVQDVLYG